MGKVMLMNMNVGADFAPFGAFESVEAKIAYVVNTPEYVNAAWGNAMKRLVIEELKKYPDAKEIRFRKNRVYLNLNNEVDSVEERDNNILIACETSKLHKNNPLVIEAEAMNEFLVLMSDPAPATAIAGPLPMMPKDPEGPNVPGPCFRASVYALLSIGTIVAMYFA